MTQPMPAPTMRRRRAAPTHRRPTTCRCPPWAAQVLFPHSGLLLACGPHHQLCVQSRPVARYVVSREPTANPACAVAHHGPSRFGSSRPRWAAVDRCSLIARHALKVASPCALSRVNPPPDTSPRYSINSPTPCGRKSTGLSTNARYDLPFSVRRGADPLRCAGVWGSTLP